MPASSSPLLSAALLAVIAAPACHKKEPTTEIPVVDDDAKVAPDEAAGGGGELAATEPAAPQRPPLHVRASAHELADVFAWVKATTTAWNPADPFDVSAQAPALLLQMGVGPGLWSEINWGGIMAVDARVPLGDDAGGEAVRAYGSIATRSARKVIEAIPEGQRPQPLGNGMWELIDESLRITLREQPTALEFAFDVRDLDQAPGLIAAAGGGRRFQVVADEIPPGFFDLGDLLDVPSGSGLDRQLRAVSEGLTQLRAEADVGVGRDLQLQVAAAAPFRLLGLDALGPARSGPTPLEERLWGAPVGALTIPWGTPGELHKFLDRQIPLDQIPEPFTAIARDAVASVHALLDQLASDVVIAVYLDARGKATLLLASNVRDEAGARSSLRALEGSIVRALESYRELAGGAKDAAFKVAFKEASGQLAGARADVLTISPPKSLAREAREAAFALNNRGELEVLSAVDGGVAVVAIGGGARDLVSKRPTTTLAADPGLALARTASGGCQLCFAVDPLAASRMSVVVRRDAAEGARAREATKLLTELQRVKSLGGIGLGAQFTADRGVVGFGVPNGLLVPDAATAAKIRGLMDRVWDPVFEGDEPPPVEPTRERKER